MKPQHIVRFGQKYEYLFTIPRLYHLQENVYFAYLFCFSKSNFNSQICLIHLKTKVIIIDTKQIINSNKMDKKINCKKIFHYFIFIITKQIT